MFARRSHAAVTVITTAALGTSLLLAASPASAHTKFRPGITPRLTTTSVAGTTWRGVRAPVGATATAPVVIAAPFPSLAEPLTVNLPPAGSPAAAQHRQAAATMASVSAQIGARTWQAAGADGVTVAAIAAPLTAPGNAGGAAVAAPARQVAISALTAAEIKAAGLPAGTIALRVRRTDGSNATSPIAVTVPTDSLRAVAGDDYPARVQWVEVADPGSGRKVDLSGSRQVGSTIVPTGPAAIVTPDVTSAARLVVSSAGTGNAADGSGDTSATPISPSSSWQVSTQTGDFSWSQSLRVPPAAAGPSPDLALTYASSAVDGQTNSTNNQGGAVGNGWSLTGGGSISRSFMTCAIDTPTGAVKQPSDLSDTGDECWRTDNATLTLGGRSTTLVKDSNGTWHLADDDGSTVVHTTGTADNGTWDDDYWVVTTTDGTQYTFGRNRLPGWRTAADSTNSVYTVPVYADDSTDPCYKPTFRTSFCDQAWQWNLDYVVDTHGNTEASYYAPESDKYNANSGPNTSTSNPTVMRAYIRGGNLKRIDYGMHAGSEITSAAPEQVTLANTKRCVTACTDHANWKDTPWDQDCTAGTCTTKTSPTFFSENLTSSISTTQSGVTGTVDSWTLAHDFPPTGEESTASLWLTSITHSGNVGGTALGLPAVMFTPGQFDNRIKKDTSDGYVKLRKVRITGITSEYGATTTIDYLLPGDPGGCTTATIVSIAAETNATRCFPQYWTPPTQGGVDFDQRLDWFVKYPVKTVTNDAVTGAGGSDQDQTNYTYANPGWRYDTSPLVPDGTRTWSQFAGFDTVTVTHGDPNHPDTEEHTTDHYLRGMKGDRLNTSGGSKPGVYNASNGTPINDELWWAGQNVESVTTNGAQAGAPIVGKTITVPWNQQTASDGTHTAQFTGIKSVDTYTTVTSGTRHGQVTNKIDVQPDGSRLPTTTPTSPARRSNSAR